MRRFIAQFLACLLAALAIPICLADSDGSFCAGRGYLAYDFWHKDYTRYLHIVRFGDPDGITPPIQVKMKEGQPQGYKCDSDRVSVFVWDRIDRYDISSESNPRYLDSEKTARGVLPDGFQSRNLGPFARSQTIILESDDMNFGFTLKITRDSFFTTTEVIQQWRDGKTRNKLKIFEGNSSIYAHHFEPQEDSQGGVAIIFDGYDNDRLPLLVQRAVRIEEFLSENPGKEDVPRALYALGRYKNQIALSAGRHNSKFFTTLKEYVETHKDDFTWSSMNGFLYLGKDWKRAIDENPDSEYADDAAYLFHTRLRGGECEGYLSCYCERSLESSGEFMKSFGGSSYFSKALDTVERQCGLNLNPEEPWSWIPLEEDKRFKRETVHDLVALFVNLRPRAPQTSLKKLLRLLERIGEESTARELSRYIEPPDGP